MIKAILIILILFSLNFNCMAFSGDISAKSAVLIEQSTGKVLFSKNQFDKMKPASTTKILTALVAIENCTEDEIVKVSQNAADTEGSSMYIEAGEKIKMENLLYGLMMNSGNDAAVAIAEHISGNTESFAKLMNSTAKKLGAEHSNFVTPNGLDDDNHYTTAHDLAIITAKAMESEDFRNLVKSKTKIVETVDGVKKYLTNHNKLLTMYEDCEGVKTGFTKASGRTLVSAAKRDDMRLIAVTLNAPDDWNDHIRMLNYGFENYELMTFFKKDLVCCKCFVNQGVKSYVSVIPEKTVTEIVRKNEADLYRVEYNLYDVNAPLKKGDIVGTASIIKEDKEICEINLVSAENTQKILIHKTYSEIIKMFFENFLK